MTEASQQHEDRMLTWSVGLMGAGLFALPTLTACVSRPGQLIWVATPWACGVMLALLGRIVGGWHRDSDAYHFAAKWGGLQALIVRAPALSPEKFGQDLLDMMNDKTEQLQELVKRVRRLNRWASALYYSTMLLFAAGIATLLWRIHPC